MLTRTSGDEFVTLESGAPVLKSAGALGGVASDVALEVFLQIVTGSISSGQANKEFLDDLSWRYYHYTDKQDKKPIQPIGNAPGLDQFSSWAEWDTYLRSHYLFDYPYRLVGFDDGKSWESSSPKAEEEYTKWYEYYSPTSSGSGESVIPSEIVLNPLAGVQDFSWRGSAAQQKVITLTMSNVNNLNQSFSSQNLKYYLPLLYYRRTIGNSNGSLGGHGLVILASETPITYTINYLETVTVNNKQLETYIFTASSETNIYTSYSNAVTLGANTTTINLQNNQNNLWVFSNTNAYDYILDTSSESGYRLFGVWTGEGGGATGPSEPVYPIYPTPEPPAPPTPPEVDGPTTITINNNTSNITNTTTTADLQPILDALDVINRNLDEFSDMFSAYANWMQAGIKALLDGVTGWLSTISGQIETWGNEFWQQLRTANRWLEGIFYKPFGGAGSEPDITLPGDGWWDWLGDILSGLLGDLTGAVSELSSAFDGLKSLFPFSIPWDIAALLGLFATAPVTPVFDLPLPFAADHTAMVHIDCSGWDGIMSAVRSVELVAFALGLALRTRDMLKGVEVEQ